MKKALYFLFLAAELFVGTLLMISLCQAMLYPVAAVAVAGVVALLVWQALLWRKAADDAAKRKIWRNIALILLIPTVAFVLTYIVIAAIFIIAFV